MVSTALATKTAGDGQGDHPVAGRGRSNDGSATKASSPSVSRMIMSCSSLAVRGSELLVQPGGAGCVGD